MARPGAGVPPDWTIVEVICSLTTPPVTLTHAEPVALDALQGLLTEPAEQALLEELTKRLPAAREAVAQVKHLDSARAGAFVGMQCDAEIARHGARWRTAEWGALLGADEGWLAKAREGTRSNRPIRCTSSSRTAIV